MASRFPLFSGAQTVARAAELFCFTPAQITGECRSNMLCKARWAVMLALHRRGWSYPRIATVTGRKDHTTCMHGVKRAAALESGDAGFRAVVRMLEAV